MDDDRFVVLNAVALKKMATAASVANATRRPLAIVRDHLQALADDGLVVVVGEQVLPTDGAEPALRRAADERYARLRSDPGLATVHERFEQVNGRFLAAMSSWQQVEVGGRKVPNRHDDPAYDAGVVAAIDRLVERAVVLLGQLAERDARFGGYADRLRRAMDKVHGGDLAALSSPLADSVHTVWFELHEDLLRTLGKERVE